MGDGETGWDSGPDADPAERVRAARTSTTWSSWLPDSPFREPWWRWGCAGHHAEEKLPATTWPCDRHVRRLVRFIAAADPTRDGRLWAAFDLFSGPPARRALLDAYLLTGKSSRVVAARTGVPPEVVAAYKTFFCDLAGRLRRGGWIACYLTGRGRYEDGGPNIGSEWKVIGYRYGIHSLDAVVAAALRFGPAAWVRGWTPPPPPGVLVRDLAAARRVVFGLTVPPTQLQHLGRLVRAAGPAGIRFAVENGVVKFRLKNVGRKVAVEDA